MTHLSRRLFLAATLGTAATRLAAQTAVPPAWQAVADRATALDQLHSLIVAQGGERVIAAAPRGRGLDGLANVKSVSKTLVAALTGAAVDRGEVTLQSTLGDVAPALIPAGADPRVARITFENLVTMRAGLERTSGGNYGGWVSSGDWVADALSRPMETEPGGRMLYSTGSIHILGAVLSEVGGASLLDLARARLGRPLGIDVPPWTRDPQGRYLGGNEMALTPTAMLRFAEMVRQGGVWDGNRVLSEAWIAAAFRPNTRSPYSRLSYGYGWFLGQAQGTDYALARGYGGQIIAVVPELDLSVVITSDPTLPARSDGYFGVLMDLIEDAIIPTARSI
ncbi:CubicO group peptidase, beta-lactamase class C family [Loktanella fryxellensis]|uniref:CubicO group peptidase, beta-lactamase class C family n=1 Tax=Loktanella fryxellensis TaxID=245187 RepID=A0A1H7YJE3_9RHOB|nr:serine hydrolase [Loktanella fryxellensis]SEM45417.1 CubicO group peptidase, beta-lactamase class C family [Loktanella fryxellensis]